MARYIVNRLATAPGAYTDRVLLTPVIGAIADGIALGIEIENRGNFPHGSRWSFVGQTECDALPDWATEAAGVPDVSLLQATGLDIRHLGRR